jgi:type III secretory pathway component EscT
MDIQRLLTSLSLKIIIQFAVVVIAVILLIALNFELLYPFYFENQLTDIGIAINSAILLLLIVGMGNILFNLLRYRRRRSSPT